MASSPRARKPRRKRPRARRRSTRPGGAGRADPAALPISEAARLLRVPPDVIRRHVDAGAPADPDGRVNLIHYAAWLVRRAARDGPAP